jgi:Putative DNA-binding domain
VPSLADVQADVCRALTSGDATALGFVLVGGRHPEGRLAIHQRHHEASLVTALLEKFPAMEWLIGSALMTQFASAFVRAHPPVRPCIAEYGFQFPIFLGAQDAAGTAPYLQQFSELEWHVGQVSIAISEPALAWSQIACVGAGALPEVKVRLQPGLRYLQATWAIDDLLKVYLAGSAPDRFALAEEDTWIQIRGARGEVQFTRLDPATFLFRTALLNGLPLGDAAERALERDERFETGQALIAVVAEGLIAAIMHETEVES